MGYSDCLNKKIIRFLWSFVFLFLFALPAAQFAQAGTFCFCHNLDENNMGNDVCTSANAFDELKGTNHFQHYLCYLCNEVCPSDHPDCGFCEDYDDPMCSVGDLRGKCNGCGNNLLEQNLGEQCDDGNNTNGDGCNENCQLECKSHEECNDGNACTDDVCNPTTGECENNSNNSQCDDGDMCTGGDVCSEGECSGEPIDSDGDGTPDCEDNCPNDPNKIEPGVCGCGVADTDSDGDGVPDCNDNCPADPNKTEPGICGCGTQDVDADGDGTPDCNDNCPENPDKVDPGVCGCALADTDSDEDGTLDCLDACPEDPNKTEEGACGCGVADTDSDADGVADCNDACPEDPNKDENPEICGCGVADTDSDADGVADCNDACPEDPNKIEEGICGCGVSDADIDADGVIGCNDNCPTLFNPDQADEDNDSIGNICDEDFVAQVEEPEVIAPENLEGSGTVLSGCSLGSSFSSGYLLLTGLFLGLSWKLRAFKKKQKSS